tara:strand:+ start:107430 stop:109250 length:1821 start_codon:yes stop_codon:yes gene_type:complete
MFVKTFEILIVWALLLGSFDAQSANSLSTEQAHSKVRLVTNHQDLQVGDNSIGLHIQLEDHWHTYWRNPGDSASAPNFHLEYPKDVVWGPLQFPRPKRIPFGPLESFGYEGEVLLFWSVNIPETLSGKDVSLVVDAEWLVCKEECIPGLFRFQLDGVVQAQAESGRDAPLFEKYRALLPEEEFLSAVSAEENGKAIVTLPNGAPTGEDFLPFNNEWVGNKKAERSESQFIFEKMNASRPLPNSARFLLLTDKKSYVVESKPESPPLALMFLYAFLGGLILNLMPCVFPVLGLKLYSIVGKEAEEKRQVVIDNLVYVFGVVSSFWVLALVIFLIRQSGEALGWGFQLQSPVFVGFLLLLFTLMGLMFLDVLPVKLDRLMGVGQGLVKKQGHLQSFFTGILAVVVSSPCTAPFMGAAMGFALSQGPLQIFMIFTALGLGLGFPFLIISMAPRLIFILPRPGQWMNHFKKAMSIPLFATAIWLGWVLSLQIGPPPSVEDGMWSEYSSAKLNQSLSKGDSVFVNYTAAWCISCQVNEKVVFQDEAIQEAFESRNVTLLKADWTNKSESIGNELKKYGRIGVPLYLYYPKGKSEPIILPEILTVDMVLDTL